MKDKLIEAKESIGGRSTFIKGTRVRVSDVARMSSLGQTPEEIEAALPHLTMQQVLAAIGYWKSHHKVIRIEIDEEDALFAKIKS